ncbi:family 10 glycosylhydrolase [Romeria aff. gracilis LEGE 07310]|uniref:Family 10 glycosylhydrolase n=2 Tax=Vasconcelosia TaxID=3366328 RepID=A0A8J7AZX6_9CYAN|nr:family 10 glycosylhydrolase [Romeria aff. gracilis LEGE 07310]
MRQQKIRVRATIVVGLVVCLALAGLWQFKPAERSGRAADSTSAELRGVWLTNVASGVFFAPWGLARALDQLADLHFNTIYPVVWNRGQTFYPSSRLEQLTGEAVEPLLNFAHLGQDVLAELTRRGHRRQLRVIPWFEYGFMVPIHAAIAQQHPDWLTTRQNGSYRLQESVFEPQALSGRQRLIDRLFHNPLAGQLAWLNPLHPAVQSLLLDLVMEVVEGYPVDGIQFDDHFSLPVEFGYDPYTIDLYRAEHGGQAPPSNPTDGDWMRWRASKLSGFVSRLHEAITAARPGCTLSLSPHPAGYAYHYYLQDWQRWVDNGWIDELVLQVYRNDLASFETELSQPGVQSARQRIPVSVGILTGTWERPIGFEQIAEQVAASRDRNFHGVSFFYWQTLWSYFTPESPQTRRQKFRDLLRSP